MALIGLSGAALGLGGAVVGARLQANGTTEGVRIELRGQRQDALWRASRDAYGEVCRAFDRTLKQVDEVWGRSQYDRETAASERHEAHMEAARSALDATMQQLELDLFNLRLTVNSAEANRAVALRENLNALVDALDEWNQGQPHPEQRARTRRRDYEWHRQACRSALDDYVDETQQRLAGTWTDPPRGLPPLPPEWFPPSADPDD